LGVWGKKAGMERIKAQIVSWDKLPVKRRKNAKIPKFKWPLWCDQTLSDLSKTAIKKPKGKFKHGFNITVSKKISTKLFYIKES